MSDKVKVLMVGAAFSGDLHIDAYARSRDLMEIVAICDKDASRIDPLAARYGFCGYQSYTDYNEAIEKSGCDVVDICLPNFLHYPVAMAALRAGKHVICEKPMATKVEHAQEMLALAAEVGRNIYYAEDWLFAPAILKALDIVEEGAIGTPLYMRVRECHSGSHSPFTQTIEYCGGGSLVHLGIHPLGFALAQKDFRWKEISAMASGGLEGNMLHRTMEGEDWGVITVRFEDGTSALIEANYVTVGGMEDVIDIYGTQGCIHVDITFSSPVKCFSIPGMAYTVEKAELTTGWSNPAVDEKFNLGYVGEIRHFMECIRDGKEAKVGLRGIDGLKCLQAIQCAYQSAREGRVIQNPDL